MDEYQQLQVSIIAVYTTDLPEHVFEHLFRDKSCECI